jgi:hypothetical protein
MLKSAGGQPVAATRLEFSLRKKGAIKRDVSLVIRHESS